MTKAVKGALLSGLVFPGLGQIALKRYRRGVVLIMAVLAGLAVIVVKVAQQAVMILETIASEGGVVDQDAISRAAAQATALSDSLIINLFLFVITFFWIYGIVDAYRIGKPQDLNHAEIPGNQP